MQFEGYDPCLYMRIGINHIPYEIVEFFNSRYPVIVGGLIPSESALGYV
jgi:ribosome biogenesis protein BMS1